MSIAAQYAKALFSAKDPQLSRLQEALRRRGHEKLLPRMYAEYEKLALRKKRSDAYQHITPEKERNRILLQLYRQLTR